MRENLLLAALPREERQRLDPFLEPLNLDYQDLLIEANQPIRHVYFPYDCVTSTIQEMSDGSMIEVGLMGGRGLHRRSVLAAQPHDFEAHVRVVRERRQA